MNESQVSSLAPQARWLAELVGELADLPGLVDDDAARIDVIAGLERLRAAVAAAHVRVIEQFAVSQEAANRELGFEARTARRGIPEQVALARRVSPASASRQVTQAKTLVRDLPRTLGLLQTGQISELVATLVVNDTSVLSAADRRAADERIAARLAGLGAKQAVAVARRVVIEVDQQAVVNRAAKARKDRRVSCRPAPDTMAVLSAMLPCEDGVRAYATLRAHADTLKAAGDPRTRDQIMADTLVERLTGQNPATGGPVDIGLIITDTALFGDADTAADLHGYGPIPGTLARDIIRRATGDRGDAASAGPIGAATDSNPGLGDDPAADAAAEVAADRLAEATVDRAAEAARVFLRRLFTDPATGTVTRVDPRRRRFAGALAALLLCRDRYCRTPFCEAPIRHLDHIRPHAAGGPTTATNGRGLCERCNYINQLPGWTARVIDHDRHIVETTTPTGHTYRSHPPPAPGHEHPAAPDDQTSEHSSRSRPPPQAA